jgi:hypothetical protein
MTQLVQDDDDDIVVALDHVPGGHADLVPDVQ